MMVKGYHAHVYFDGAVQRAHAMTVRAAVESRFAEAQLGRIHERGIAFHPLPMFQIAMPGQTFATLVPWLMLNRGPLSVMVHPLTGDAWREHTQYCMWLGTPVQLDQERLRRAASAA